MSYRHIDEIDRAVFVARKGVSLGHLKQQDTLTRFLYQRWYLGLTPQQVQVPRQRREVWRAWSPDWDHSLEQAGSALVRLHLAAAPHATLHTVALVSERAKTFEVPWKLTSTALRSTIAAPDATVLYLPMADLSRMRPALDQMIKDLQPFLGSTAPALTLRIARGATLAQNPSDGRSFGVHRCSLVAASVLASQQFHHREQVQRTLHTFERAGIDPRRPYLESSNSWDRLWVAA